MIYVLGDLERMETALNMKQKIQNISSQGKFHISYTQTDLGHYSD